MKIKLNHQLNLMFMIVGFVILTISSIATYYQIIALQKEQSEQSTVILFRQMEKGIVDFRRNVEKNSVELLLDPKVRKFLRNDASPVDHILQGLELGKQFKKVSVQNRPFDSIMLFADNGELISESNSVPVFFQHSREQPFYHSDMYTVSSSQTFQMFWFGGTTVRDFVNRGLLSDKSNSQLISAVRYIGTPQKNGAGGVLVINIAESELASLYRGLSDQKGTNAYIMDESGIVISSQLKMSLGRTSDVFRMLNKDTRYGSIEYKDSDGVSKLAVYYYLQDIDWVLVKEIPMALLNRDSLKLQRILVIAWVSSLLLMMLFSNYWTRWLLKPMKVLANTMQKLELGQIGIQVDKLPGNEIGVLSRQFNRMSGSIADLLRHNELIERKKRDQEVKALQAQISPHFLYNTLSVIRWMAVAGDTPRVVEGLVALGNMLHPFHKHISLFWSLKNELDYTVNYIKLMNMRYGDGILLNVDSADVRSEVRTLKFILQPVVENAVQHGFEHNQFKGEIHITVLEQHGDMIIRVADDGTGMSEEQLERVRQSLSAEYDEAMVNPSIGLRNTHHRIQLHFGGAYGISIHSRIGSGTLVEIRFPMQSEASM